MIEVTGLVKKYGNHVAVDHLSFRLEPGKIYGKSTTMNMMTGYIGPTEGTILINGHDIVKEPAEAKRCIGYLPELPPLYTDMTVWEYLEFAAQLKNIPAKKRQESILNAMKMKTYQKSFKGLPSESRFCTGCAWYARNHNT